MLKKSLTPINYCIEYLRTIKSKNQVILHKVKCNKSYNANPLSFNVDHSILHDKLNNYGARGINLGFDLIYVTENKLSL